MKKHLLLYFFCAFFLNLSAQQLPNYFFSNPTTLLCPYDSSNFNGFNEWEGFQTADSSYWGVRDTHCTEIASPPAQQLSVFLDGGITTHPTFVASKLDSLSAVQLDSNGMYKVTFYLFGNDSLRLLLGSNCPEGLCSGMQVGIEIPDSSGTGTDMRWYSGSGTLDFTGSILSVEFCFPTERFVNANRIRHAYLKFTPNGSNPGVVGTAYSVDIEDMKSMTEGVRAIDATFNGTNYEFHMNAYSNWACFCPNKLMIYTASTYPQANQLSYVEVAPSPNVNTQQTIDLYVDLDATLMFQPFTELRGGLVQGDTIRHNVNLVNNGGTLCTYPFIDLHFENGDGYTHRAGKLDMQGPNACMQFGKAGKLTVDHDAKLSYGKPGQGMLALRSGGKIVLKHNAELVVEHLLAFGEYRWEDSPQTFEVYLQPGSKLTFGQDAILTNSLSAFPHESKLDVYMEGGTLDDTKLSHEERALIRRIYPSAHDAFADNLKVLGNPFGDLLECTFTSDRAMSVDLELITLDGRVASQHRQSVDRGVNRIQWPQPALVSGMYLLRLSTPYGTCAKRVSKL